MIKQVDFASYFWDWDFCNIARIIELHDLESSNKMSLCINGLSITLMCIRLNE